MRVPEATCTGNAATGYRFGSSKLQIINHKALETLAMTTTAGRKTKLTCSFSYHRSKGTTSLPRCWRRGATVRHARHTFRSLAKPMEEAQVVPFHTPTHRRNRKERRSLQSIPIDDNGTPLSHGLLVLSSSKPLTGRTGHYRLRDASVYWNHWRYSLHGNTPTTGQGLVP